jgi:hypothetical protein
MWLYSTKFSRFHEVLVLRRLALTREPHRELTRRKEEEEKESGEA